MKIASPEGCRVVCILGMHRSGTSCLTGSLQAAGLFLGRHHTWNRYNQKGNRENQDFVDFHNALLDDNKASWDQPPRKLRYTTEHQQQALALIQQFDEHSAWGFKDPRALLCLPLWNQLLPDMHPIGIFRHPLAVANSLRKRDSRMSQEQCLQLWYHYNRCLYRQYRKQPFPILSFDWDEEHFHQRLNSIISALELTPLSEEQRFYTPSLHTHSAQELEQLPWKIRRLYRKLQDASTASI